MKATRSQPQWWRVWIKEWGKAYITAGALDKLWQSIPVPEKQIYESTYNFCLDAFEDETHFLREVR